MSLRFNYIWYICEFVCVYASYTHTFEEIHWELYYWLPLGREIKWLGKMANPTYHITWRMTDLSSFQMLTFIPAQVCTHLTFYCKLNNLPKVTQVYMVGAGNQTQALWLWSLVLTTKQSLESPFKYNHDTLVNNYIEKTNLKWPYHRPFVPSNTNSSGKMLCSSRRLV